MERDSFRFRTPAKVVAVIDLTFTVASLLILAIEIKTCLPLYLKLKSSNLAWTLAYISVLFLAKIIGLAACAKLLRATNEGVEPSNAKKKVKFWMAVTTISAILFLFNLSKDSSSPDFVFSVIDLVFFLVEICVVYNYLQELEHADYVDSSVNHSVSYQPNRDLERRTQLPTARSRVSVL